MDSYRVRFILAMTLADDADVKCQRFVQSDRVDLDGLRLLGFFLRAVRYLREEKQAIKPLNSSHCPEPIVVDAKEDLPPRR